MSDRAGLGEAQGLAADCEADLWLASEPGEGEGGLTRRQVRQVGQEQLALRKKQVGPRNDIIIYDIRL